MLHRKLALCAALMALPPVAHAQLVSGAVGPTFPTGRFNELSQAGTGMLLSGRLNLSVLPLLQLQFELTTVRGWQFGETTTEGPRDLGITTGGANLALHFVRVATIRPYALAGLVGSNQSRTGGGLGDDDSFRFGYQTGLGLDFKLGPLTPFAEVRWVSLDMEGDDRLTYVPVLFGIKIL